MLKKFFHIISFFRRHVISRLVLNDGDVLFVFYDEALVSASDLHWGDELMKEIFPNNKVVFAIKGQYDFKVIGKPAKQES